MADEIYMTVDRRINEWRDGYKKRLEDIENWLMDIVTMKMKDNACVICGLSNPDTALEAHHIAGEKHHWQAVMVCHQCHSILSKEQRLWDHRWLNFNQPEDVKKAFYLQGLIILLRLKGRKCLDSNYEVLASSLIEDVNKLLGGPE